MRILTRREAVLIALFALLLVVWLGRLAGLAVVEDGSMEPALRDGQVCVWLRWAPVRCGSVVLAWDSGELLAHRVVYLCRTDRGGRVLVIAGDSGEHSCAVGGSQIVGVIVWPRTTRRVRGWRTEYEATR